MRTRWHREDAAQSMILVALAIVVLLGAVALAVDWGYGLTQRRVMQTSSDAAALAVGRYLATSVVEMDGQPVFTVTEAGACDIAMKFVGANWSFAPSDGDLRFTLQFGTTAPIVWTDVDTSADCALASATAVPADAVYVRVTTAVTYRSLVAGVLGFPTTTAAASARAFVFGTGVPTTAPVWPMVRHYDKSDFDIKTRCAPLDCDPTTVTPTTFWSPNEEDVVYANGFKGMVDLSRDSPIHAKSDGSLVPQFITGWDESGSPSGTPPTEVKTDMSGNCPSGWDTKGGEDPQNADKQCSIPNWFYYSFQGELSLKSTWPMPLSPGREQPSYLTGRPSICGADHPHPSPSCDNFALGDWLETAGGNVGSGESSRMLERIRDQGFVGPFSDRPVDPKKPGGAKFGKALVVLIYLWDCAETFTPTQPDGQQWDLIPGAAGDCSRVSKNDKPDRVHLFTAAPFTFYEGLVSSQVIQGYWGGMFGDARDCEEWVDGVPVCMLNPLANSAILVADDGYSGP